MDQETCMVCGSTMVPTPTGWYCRRCRKTRPVRAPGHCRECETYAILNGQGLCFPCERKTAVGAAQGPSSLTTCAGAIEGVPAGAVT
ncbi:MAG: hypothetical protein KAT70_00525, partial [Thermoplasmata archaeon]|nr:hypothetical protein [Thermoplasmata archaeon]